MSTTPEPETSAPQPVRRLWHEEPTSPGTPLEPRPRSRQRIIFQLLAWMVAIFGAILGLLFLLRPVPRPYFVPLEVADYRSRFMPVLKQGEPDRQAFREGGFFRRILLDAYASQDRIFLVKDLAALRTLAPGETVVLYLGGYSCSAGKGEVFLFPGDVVVDVTSTRLRLRDVLEALRDCPARAKLLVLDIMQPLSARIGPDLPPGRVGVLIDDVSSRVEAELAAVPDPRRRVLSPCSPGQTSRTSEALGHSVLAFYLDEGLRGWADVLRPGGNHDGRVDVEELTEFVRYRVDRWSRHNGNGRQTPVGYGSGPSFELVALERGRPRPRNELDALAIYPEWLVADWQLLDQWRQQRYYQNAPRDFRLLEAGVYRAEARWRGGAPRAEVEKDRQPLLDLAKSVMQRARDLVPRPHVHSLAMARALGQVPDPAVATALQTMLTQLATETQGLPAEKGAPVRAKLVGEFLAKHKDTPYYDLASAVFEAALNDTRLNADQLQLLNSLLTAHQTQLRYAETALLRRLAHLAEETGSAKFPAGTARLALQVVAQGEKAVTRPAGFAWLRGLLEQAAQAQHDGEVLLLAWGYAPTAQAEDYLRQASNLYSAVLAYEDIIAAAKFARDDAWVFLPSYVGYLEETPGMEADWQGAITATIALNEVLVREPVEGPPPTADQLAQTVDQLRQRTAAVNIRVGELRQPFGAAAVNQLIEQSKRPTAGGAVAVQLNALLRSTYLTSKQRVAVWHAGQELERRLYEELVELDAEREPPAVLPSADMNRGTGEREQRERADRRARMAVALFRLAGFPQTQLDALENARQQAFQPGAPTDSVYALGEMIRVAWAEWFPAHLKAESNVHALARLSDVYPPFDFWSVSRPAGQWPRLLLLTQEAQSLWAWLALRSQYAARDYAGAELNFESARDYADASGRPMPAVPYVGITGCSGTPGLNPERPATTCTLRLQFALPPNVKPVGELQILTADNDWLRITPGIAAPGAGPEGPWPVSPDPASGEATVPLRIALRPGAALSGTTPPRGFMVAVTAGGLTYHHLVPLSISLRADHPEIVLSANPKEPTDPLGDLRLRPANTTQPFYLYVRNPTDKAQTILVELSAAGNIAGGTSKMLVAPKATQQVVFLTLPPTAPATPPATPATPAPILAGPPPLPELSGPLTIRLLDAANPSNVLDSRDIRVGIALPREYVRVESISFAPPAQPGGADQLTALLRARTPLAPPPCTAELLLPPDRLPGFLAAKVGTFRGVVPPDAKTDLRLFAAQLQFAEGSPRQGEVYINVDSYARAFIFRTTFPTTGEAASPQEDYQPALRLRADPYNEADPKFTVHMDVDNAPGGATLELSLGRMVDGTFRADLVRKFATAREQRIGFSPSGPGGALLFQAGISDWTVKLDASLIIGPRLLRARLLDMGGTEIRTATLRVTLANRPPSDVQFINAPAVALRGAPLAVQAMGFDSATGVQQVSFFVGKPIAGKLPPNTATTPGTQVNGGNGVWAAQLPIPLTAAGPTDVSVMFVNNAGLTAFATTSVNVVEKLPPATGTVQGTVLVGAVPQPNLEVVLRNPRAQELFMGPPPPANSPPPADKGMELKTKTKPDGTYVFENVAPGPWTVFSQKTNTGQAGQKAVTVEAGKTATADIALFAR